MEMSHALYVVWTDFTDCDGRVPSATTAICATSVTLATNMTKATLSTELTHPRLSGNHAMHYVNICVHVRSRLAVSRATVHSATELNTANVALLHLYRPEVRVIDVYHVCCVEVFISRWRFTHMVRQTSDLTSYLCSILTPPWKCFHFSDRLRRC